jgi:deoxycytidylate deaminase
MSRDTRHHDLALKIASTSPHRRARHGAVIARGSRVISLGVNSFRTHPLARNCTIHAELAAIVAASGNVSGATLYSARLLANGQPGMSKPCARCARLIRAYGIAKIVYHDGENILRESVG